ncbi:MAG: hypothetical protein CMN91_12165 [Synechococcus sp. ARS1019]|nr:hypothetical protein [Synechococcus sp. ARS1019]
MIQQLIMVGYLELMLMVFHSAQLPILLVLLKIQELVHTLPMAMDYSRLQVRQDFLYSPVYLVEVYSNLKVHLSPTLVYLLLVMDISMECLAKVQKALLLNTMVMVHSENSVVQQSLLPSIHWRGRCSSPSMVRYKILLSLTEHLVAMVYCLHLKVVEREHHLIMLVLVLSLHSTNLRKQELTSTTVVLLFHSWILTTVSLLIKQMLLLQISQHRLFLPMKLLQLDLSELVSMR